MKIIFGNTGHSGHSTHVATRKIVSSHTSRNTHGPLLPENQSLQDYMPEKEDHSLKLATGIGAVVVALATAIYIHRAGGQKPPKA